MADQFAAVDAAAEGCDVVVAGGALAIAAHSVAERRGIGYVYPDHGPGHPHRRRGHGSPPAGPGDVTFPPRPTAPASGRPARCRLAELPTPTVQHLTPGNRRAGRPTPHDTLCSAPLYAPDTLGEHRPRTREHAATP